MKTAVIYWSATGNTEAMANAVIEGASAAGADTQLFTASEFSCSKISEFDTFAFGCPSMGVEVLEEDEFAPMFDACLPSLSAKKLALFGSYGWGDGEWMRNWEQTCKGAGISLACDSVICNEYPDEDALTACRALGAALAK